MGQKIHFPGHRYGFVKTCTDTIQDWERIALFLSNHSTIKLGCISLCLSISWYARSRSLLLGTSASLCSFANDLFNCIKYCLSTTAGSVANIVRIISTNGAIQKNRTKSKHYYRRKKGKNNYLSNLFGQEIVTKTVLINGIGLVCVFSLLIQIQYHRDSIRDNNSWLFDPTILRQVSDQTLTSTLFSHLNWACEIWW